MLSETVACLGELLFTFTFTEQWVNLLLADNFATDAMLAVEATEHHRRDELVGEAAVEEHAALLESAARPLLQGVLRQQEVVVLFAEKSFWPGPLVADQ